MALRFDGYLKKLHADRGFGFIAADDDGQELFFYISVFARDQHLPMIGDRLSFEVEPDRDGNKRAVRVRRPGAVHVASAPAPLRSVQRDRRDVQTSGYLGKLISVALISAMAWYGYSHYATSSVQSESELPAPSAILPDA
jgi:cold shock CspA family protein